MAKAQFAERLVIVEWTDSAGQGAWNSSGQLKPMTCHSVGWISDETEDVITLSGSRNDEKDWADRTAIPKAVIRSIDDLRRK